MAGAVRVLITGAGGFVGRHLVRRLLSEDAALGQPLERLILIDRQFDGGEADGRVDRYEGSITDARLLRRALAGGVDVVFHLASVPGGLAEREYELGRQVNLDATLQFLEQLREQRQRRPPSVVFSSSVAVYGEPLPAVVDDSTLPRPTLTYGAHKLIGESWSPISAAGAGSTAWRCGCPASWPDRPNPPASCPRS